MYTVHYKAWMMMEDNNHIPLSTSRSKNWGDLKQAVRELRRQISCLSSRVPSSFSFRNISPSIIRIYFLCSPANGRETTLFFCDVDTAIAWYVEVHQNNLFVSCWSLNSLKFFTLSVGSLMDLPLLGIQ